MSHVSPSWGAFDSDEAAMTLSRVRLFLGGFDVPAVTHTDVLLSILFSPILLYSSYRYFLITPSTGTSGDA